MTAGKMGAPTLRIRELRTERGYGQKATARRAGIEPARLCEIELNRGNPKLSTLAKIAGALDVEVPDLFAPSGKGPAQPRSYRPRFRTP